MRVFYVLFLLCSQAACAHEIVECGGFVGIPCSEGFVCQLHNPSVVDSYGVCVPE